MTEAVTVTRRRTGTIKGSLTPHSGPFLPPGPEKEAQRSDANIFKAPASRSLGLLSAPLLLAPAGSGSARLSPNVPRLRDAAGASPRLPQALLRRRPVAGADDGLDLQVGPTSSPHL